MKTSNTARATLQSKSKELTMDPRKSSNIQIEYNVPFSKLNPRIEKENMDSINSNLSLHSLTLKEEEDAQVRDQKKKKKAEEFFKKVQQSSKNIMQQKKKENQIKEEKKKKEQERIAYLTSKPRILPPKKSPKKKIQEQEEITDPGLESSVYSKALTDRTITEEISNLSFSNPYTVLQKNGVIRNHMASLSKSFIENIDQSSISFSKTDR